MQILKIVFVGLLVVVSSVLLKQIKPELSFFVSIAGGIVILYLLIDDLSSAFDSIKLLVSKTSVDFSLFKSVLKVVGIGYITEFGSSLCIDSGNSSIAEKIMFAGKISILMISMPIINKLIEIVVGIMPWKKR